MRRTTNRVAAAVLAVAAFGWAGCGDGGDDGTGPGADITVEELRGFFDLAMLGLPVAVEGFQRLHEATVGGDGEGVTLENLGGGAYTAGIALDLDGDANRETTVSGGATNVVLDEDGDFVSGRITLDGIDGGGVTGSGSTTAEVIGGGGPENPIILTTGGSFEFSSGEVRVTVTDMGVTTDLTFPNAPFLEGFIDFEVGDIDATVFFEPTGTGGWRARVAGTAGGSVFEFTVG